MFVKLRNLNTNEVEQVKVGFSWTMFFFGAFVPLLRGDWKWLLISLLANSLSIGFFCFILSFVYNKIYIKEKLNNNWVPNSESDAQSLKQANILF